VIELVRAEPADIDFLVELANHPEIEPFLGERRARTPDAIAEQIERSQREPERFGRLVIRVDGTRAGVLGYDEVSPHNRIARLEALAVHPSFRGRRIADDAARQLQRLLLLELGFHRLQLECYGFNERAIAHAERVGFVREGVKRKAYLRHGEWTDSVLFALLKEDLERPPDASPHSST
jgi:L-phenylalanine/L-methionine N-acetyltransferase